jgi:SAM-dependent methyltransferase
VLRLFAVGGFDARGYWENRLTERQGLDAVGWAGLGQDFNRWMYRLRRRIWRRDVAPLVRDPERAQVLDIGSGTGFYIDRWREAGVRSITGSDITATAVGELAAAYPDHEFVRFDAGGDAPEAIGRTFDFVSAIDVLFHIVDDERFDRAIHTIAALVKPGGYFVVTDNFVHGDPVRHAHHVSRTLTGITATLVDAGFEVVSRRPMFFLMNDPLDSSSRLLRYWWGGLTELLERSNRLGRVAGACLYPLELALVSTLREGPSTELMICRRAA